MGSRLHVACTPFRTCSRTTIHGSTAAELDATVAGWGPTNWTGSHRLDAAGAGGRGTTLTSRGRGSGEARDGLGRFAKGNPGGPGRLPRATEVLYLSGLCDDVSLDTFLAVVSKAASKPALCSGCDRARAEVRDSQALRPWYHLGVEEEGGGMGRRCAILAIGLVGCSSAEGGRRIGTDAAAADVGKDGATLATPEEITSLAQCVP